MGNANIFSVFDMLGDGLSKLIGKPINTGSKFSDLWNVFFGKTTAPAPAPAATPQPETIATQAQIPVDSLQSLIQSVSGQTHLPM